MMQRALIWLNLYGREDVRHKLKNGLKTPKKHFLTVFELMSDSLTKMTFFQSAILNFFSRKKNCFIPMKTSQSLLVSKDGSKF